MFYSGITCEVPLLLDVENGGQLGHVWRERLWMHKDSRTGTVCTLSATQLWLLSISELRSGYRIPVSLIPTVQETVVFLHLARLLPRGGGTAKYLVCFGGVLKPTTSDATQVHPVTAQI